MYNFHEITKHLSEGQRIPYWTVQGYTGRGTLEIIKISTNKIIIRNSKGNERPINYADLIGFSEIWNDYKNKKIDNKIIPKITHNATYIRSIFHHIEK